MSDIVERAIERLRQMPEERQELFARFVLHEIGEDERWIRSTESNEGKLQGLIEKILEVDDDGKSEP